MDSPSSRGSAFLHARREVQRLHEPLVVSRGWEPERTNLLSLDGGASRFVLEHEWHGMRDPAAHMSVPAALAKNKKGPICAALAASCEHWSRP